MARMAMRTREAPMDWEREQDRNLPNIFTTPQPLESESTSRPLSKQSSSFGLLSLDRGQLSKESSFSFQNNQKPFSHNSPLHTSKQGSFSISQERSLSRPQSPQPSSGIPSGTAISAPSSTNQLHDEKKSLLTGPSVNGCQKSSFDMKSLISDVFDHNDHRQQYDRSQQRSTTRKELSGPLETSSRGRTSLQYRNNTAPSSFWSDDEEPKDQDEDGAYDSDEKENDVRRHNEARNFNHNRQRMSRRNIKDQRTNSLRREVSQPHLQDQYPSKGRVWSENVDLPFILSGYVQVAMNTVFVGILIYIIANFIATIQSDVSMRMEGILNREIKKIERCRVDYYETYSCHKKHGPALFTVCENLLSCKEQPLPRIARATVAAETFAHIVNSFVNTMSYKTMGFVMVIVFGGLYFSNQAISSYRSNHVMHHQHTVVSPSNIPSRLNSTRSFSSISNGSQSRSDNNAKNPYGFPTSSTSHDNSFAIDQPSRSGQLVQRRFGVQRHDSLRDLQQDSDEDFDMDI